MIELHKDTQSLSRVVMGDLTVWFSYETPIAVTRTIDKSVWIIRHNDWSNTTGDHLNNIDSDKSKRITGTEFEKQLEKALRLNGVGFFARAN